MADRIDTATKSADLFGAGKDGFTAGNPPTVAATRVSAKFLNGLQEAIVRPIEAAGYTPDADDYNQFLYALVKLQQHFVPENGDDVGYWNTFRTHNQAGHDDDLVLAGNYATEGIDGTTVYLYSPALPVDGVYTGSVRLVVTKVGDPTIYYTQTWEASYYANGGTASIIGSSTMYSADGTGGKVSPAMGVTGATARIAVTMAAEAGTVNYNFSASWNLTCVKE